MDKPQEQPAATTRPLSSSLVLFTLLALSLICALIAAGDIGTAKAAYPTVPVGSAPVAIAFDSANGNLYVVNSLSNTVSVISGRTNTVIASPIPVGGLPEVIAFDSANGDLYVTNSGFSGFTVSVIATTIH
jgi:YVTN family beta-propeller protein